MPVEDHEMLPEETVDAQEHRPVTPHLDPSSDAKSLATNKDKEEEQNVYGDNERIHASPERVFSEESPKSYVRLTHLCTGWKIRLTLFYIN